MLVREGWDAAYDDPVIVEAGGRLRLTGERDVWDGFTWIWAISKDGKEGWVPDTLIIETAEGVFAAEAFSAVELTCLPGAELDILRETHGWAWCRDAQGSEGWVPLRNLDRSGSDPA